MKLSLNIALKEWAITCRALRDNRQIVLLRKGGILEARNGFQIAHDRFLLFPTYLHQSLPQVKTDVHHWFEAATVEPAKIIINTACEVTDIIKLKSRAQMTAIDDYHIWTQPLIDLRFDYKPQNPLFLLLVRAYQLDKDVIIDNTPRHAGCKSWVAITDAISTGGAIPTMPDEQFDEMRQRILTALA